MIVGYARVSTEDQKLDLQIQALEKAGCDRIFTDHGVSGFGFVRDGLDEVFETVRPGGTLVVWRLDRLGRSLSGLVQLVEKMGERGIHLRSISEHIDTSSSGGRLMFHLMAALAEFERSIISERTRAGMAAAQARGAPIGRPKSLTTEQLHMARGLIEHEHPRDVAEKLKVSVRTLQRGLANLSAASSRIGVGKISVDHIVGCDRSVGCRCVTIC